MDISIYVNEFTKKAQELNYTEDHIMICLEYARSLYNKGVPIIYDQEHLSKLVGVNLCYLYGVTNNSVLYYRKFKIKKRSGRKRIIQEPLPLLKEIQKWICENILIKLDTSIYSKAYKRGMSIKDNAKFHKKQKRVIAMDIKDYFTSIKFYKVYNLFSSLGYKEEVAVMLSKLCTYNGYLPQGAPTSPMLSNLVTKQLDEKIFNMCMGIDSKTRYSRYADDMTFSGDISPDILIRKVRRIINTEGFTINDAKTRVYEQNKCQKVTGIVVNSKMQISRTQRDGVRQEVYYLCKYGIKEHLLRIKWNKSQKAYIRNLWGRVNYILFVNPKDNKISKCKVQLEKFKTKLI